MSGVAAAATTQPFTHGRTAPIRLLAARLRALTPGDPHRYGVSEFRSSIPAQPEPDRGWKPASAVPALIEIMRSGSGKHLTISPALAGATMSGNLGYAAVGRLAVALSVAGQAYDTGPDSLMLRLTGEGLVEQIAVRRPILAVLPDDPLAGRPRVEVLPDRAALIGWAAARAWATLAPLLEELHRTTRYGLVPMWNQVADSVLGPATVAPRLAGLDRPEQWSGRAVGTALINGLIARGAPIRRHGTVREELIDDRLALAPVRGSCCLKFRQTQERCASCPLVGR